MADASKLAIAALRARRTDVFLAILAKAPQIAAKAGVIVDAARVHDDVALRALVKSGADPNACIRKYRPLHAAIQETPHHEGPTGAEEKLACEKDASSLTALHYACVSRLHRDAKTGRALREIAELLLERGADATAILPAALWNTGDEFARFAELCIAHGANVDRSSHEGKPLLNQLVRWGQVKPALWLMERGANPNLADDRGWTAVHQAASRGNARMLAAAVKAGGDLDQKAKDGTTPRALAKAKRLVIE